MAFVHCLAEWLALYCFVSITPYSVNPVKLLFHATGQTRSALLAGVRLCRFWHTLSPVVQLLASPRTLACLCTIPTDTATLSPVWGTCSRRRIRCRWLSWQLSSQRLGWRFHQGVSLADPLKWVQTTPSLKHCQWWKHDPLSALEWPQNFCHTCS